MAKQALSRSGFDYMTNQQDLLGIFKQSNFGVFVTGRFSAGKSAELGNGFGTGVTTTGINLTGGRFIDTGLYASSYTRGAACFSIATAGALTGVFVLRVSASATAAQLTLHIDIGNQTWTIYRGTLAGTVLATGISAAITNIGGYTYMPIQFGWEIHDTTGRIYLRVNGTTLIDGTANFDTNNAGGGIWDRVSMGAVGDGTSMPVDDLLIFNMDADAFTTLPRDARFYLGVPTSDGTVTWTPSSGTNWAAVETNNGDTLYNSSLTVGQEDIFNVSSTWLPNGSTIYGTPQLVRISRIDDATPHDVKSAVKSGGSTSYGATTADFSTYTLFADEIALDPNGGIAWTLSALQSVDIGYNLVL